MDSTLRAATFRLEQDLLDGLLAVKDRDGVSVTEQVRRAVQAWLKEKGIDVKAVRKRAATRRRA